MTLEILINTRGGYSLCDGWYICAAVLTPFFTLWQDRARSFWGVFSHPPTQKRSFGYKSSQNSIFLAPKYHFSLDLFGSNFQWPAAHPQQFSDRVPPPPGINISSGDHVLPFCHQCYLFVIWSHRNKFDSNSGCPAVREKSGKFQTWEKWGNFVEGQGKNGYWEKSGNLHLVQSK